MTLVIDASVAVKLYVAEHDSQPARGLFAAADALIGPELILFEVTSALHRKCRRGEVSERQVLSASRDLPFWFARLWPMADLHQRACVLALQTNHPVYDCAYLALAEETGFEFVTADRRLHKVANDLGLVNVRGL
jgi:predicted nucleic acid-binding protein